MPFKLEQVFFESLLAHSEADAVGQGEAVYLWLVAVTGLRDVVELEPEDTCCELVPYITDPVDVSACMDVEMSLAVVICMAVDAVGNIVYTVETPAGLVAPATPATFWTVVVLVTSLSKLQVPLA